MVEHGFAANNEQASVMAAKAGSDMDMESYAYINHLQNQVETGQVDETLIDDAVRRILRVKFELGLFDDPYRYCDEEREKERIGHADHFATALDMAKRSIVLLKNENDLLPLAKSKQNIAVIGALADDNNSPLGNWRLAAEYHTAVSLWDAMVDYTSNTLSYTKGPELATNVPHFHTPTVINETDRNGIEEAVTAAQKAEIVVIVLGEYGMQSGEGRSRTDIGLPGLQQELLEAVYAVNQNIVLVLMNGRPLAIPWAGEHIPAIVEAWHLGTQSGHAITQVLYGDYNPGGKLPMSFPRSVGQVPIYYNHKNTGRPGPEDVVFWSHYTDQSNTPLYPFGHGLSYTTFAYDKLEISTANRAVTVNVTVSNTGKVVGEEVVQLYIRDKVASITRPVKELKGFEKIMLQAGESKQISFTLTEEELGFYNNQGEFITEAGGFDVMVGGSSTDGLTGSFRIK